MDISERKLKEKNKHTNISGNFGSNFQVDSCIFMYLKNIKKCKYLGFESGEDYDFVLKDGSVKYFQAKSATTKDSIIKHNHMDAIRKAVYSFGSVSNKSGEFNVVFNFKSPFIDNQKFGSIPYETVNFDELSDGDKDNIKTYLKKHNTCVDTKNVKFHYLRYDYSNSESYIYSKINDFLVENNINLSSKEVGNNWFVLLQRNGKEDYYLDSGVMAGSVFLSLAKQNSFISLIDRINNGIEFDDQQRIKSIFINFFDSSELSFLEFAPIRTHFFDYLKKNRSIDLPSAALQFSDIYSSIEDAPKYFDSIVEDVPEGKKALYKNQLFRIYIAVHSFNSENINKIKGVFGYDN